jgi:SP family myo-inositol transporter-like MFS transporter 13
LISSVLALAAIFGASAYKCITSTFGDLTTFRYFDYLTIVASLIQMLNLSVGTQVFARILLGLVVGMNTILIPVYLTSCLPGSMGGPAGTLNQLFITIGIFFGYFIGYLVVG